MTTASQYIPQRHLEIVPATTPFDITDYEVDYMEEQIVLLGYDDETNIIPFAKFEAFAEKQGLIGHLSHGTEEWTVSLSEYLEEYIEFAHLKQYISLTNEGIHKVEPSFYKES